MFNFISDGCFPTLLLLKKNNLAFTSTGQPLSIFFPEKWNKIVIYSFINAYSNEIGNRVAC